MNILTDCKSQNNDYCVNLDDDDKNCIKAKSDLCKKYRFLKLCNNNLNNLVPELNFGFWKSLINKGFYQNTIWNPCSKQIFKYAKKSERNINSIKLKIKNIHKLRNRTFHHEPIWNYLNIDIVHSDIHFFINWINPKIGNWLREYDRFPEIYEITSNQLDLIKIYLHTRLLIITLLSGNI